MKTTNERRAKARKTYAATGRVPTADALDALDDLDEALAELEATKARLAEVERERDEAREGYHRLDDNWATLHNAGMNALRVALHMPDATVPEMVERIAAISATGGKETK